MSEHIEQIIRFLEYMDGGIDLSLIEDVISELGGDEPFIWAMNNSFRGGDDINFNKDPDFYGDDDKALALYKRYPDNINACFLSVTSRNEPNVAVVNKAYYAGEDTVASDEAIFDMVAGGDIANDDIRAITATRFALDYIASGYGYFYQREVDYSVYGDPSSPDFYIEEDDSPFIPEPKSSNESEVEAASSDIPF